ncbi:hypothetical protein TREMEDRAFT_63386 [Tremella mesenterica DSM 1558]|uniref:uncharacterized protein n=1 Tax=Tremella mesenterica (strain ATCC 24925 / CBS 8224 / DSM 1558 / NBRC 9311 / NRRL Y-6157 / RJB 2259-6 / UBC 559-6) TaxID=578456 RepID=UPI0003F49ECA|nr:uncharacterized protein TREMEDRAFT_63386 [Tremella mesenterica DSM 1558]EIW68222.1 hypothetical protein TREMEDRAFT_63386 [Tremella mesenterica DSM 1558]
MSYPNSTLRKRRSIKDLFNITWDGEAPYDPDQPPYPDSTDTFPPQPSDFEVKKKRSISFFRKGDQDQTQVDESVEVNEISRPRPRRSFSLFRPSTPTTPAIDLFGEGITTIEQYPYHQDVEDQEREDRQDYDIPSPPYTPITPTTSNKPTKKRSWFNLRRKESFPVETETTVEQPTTPEDMDTFVHHTSYFPEYEPIFTPSSPFSKTTTAAVSTQITPNAQPVNPVPPPPDQFPHDEYHHHHHHQQQQQHHLHWNTGNKLKKGKVHFHPDPHVDAYPTPETTPVKVTNPKDDATTIKGMPHVHPLLQQNYTKGADWHHHESYFPEYTPIFPPISKYTGTATPYMMSAAEKQATWHSKTLGHAVTVHYPDLPSWADYGKNIPKTQGSWQSGRWGVEGWTGYGYDGEKLPNAQGETFGAPMDKGVLSKTGDDGKGGGKGKKGKGGGASGKGEGDGDGEDGDGGGDEDEKGEEGGGEGGTEEGTGQGIGGGSNPSGGGSGTSASQGGQGGGGKKGKNKNKKN